MTFRPIFIQQNSFISASNDHEHLVEQNIGNISAPLQSPAIDLCDVSTAMTRSRSLNSPLVSGATGTCQHMDQAASTRNKRRHSGKVQFFLHDEVFLAPFPNLICPFFD